MRQRWEKHWEYLQRRDVQSSKRAAWSAVPSSRHPNSRHAQRELEEKKRRLEERREKLAQLLHEEQLSYEVCMYFFRYHKLTHFLHHRRR